MRVAVRLATYEDLLAASGEQKWEVVSGALIAMPAPLPRHSKVQRVLGSRVGGPFDDDDGFGGPGGWWICLEPDVRFGPHPAQGRGRNLRAARDTRIRRPKPKL